MLSPTHRTDPSAGCAGPSASDARTQDLQPPQPNRKLWNIISLYESNPGVLGALLQELRATELYVAKATPTTDEAGSLTLACAEIGSESFVVAFVDRDEAESEVSTNDPNLTVVATSGAKLISQLSRASPPLGLCLNGMGRHVIFDVPVIAAGGALGEERCPIKQQQLLLMPFAATIPSTFRTELEIFCLQHPNITRAYLCTEQQDGKDAEDIIVLIGDPTGSTVNVEDLLGIIAYRTGVILGPDPVSWAMPESEEMLQRIGIDCVYAKR